MTHLFLNLEEYNYKYMNRCTSAADKLRRLALALMLASALSSCTKAELIGARLSSLQSLASSITNTPLPTLTLDSSTVTIAEGSVATFTVTLSQASTQTVTVDYATVNGTAKSGRDYTAATGTLTFTPGVTSQTLTVTTLANSLYSDPLTYQVHLSNAVNATAGADGSGSITNLDPPPTISFVNATNFEGCGAIFVARQSAVTLKDTVITWSTADGTALAGTNYTAVNTTTTLPAGALEVGLSVPLLDDSITAADKTFTVTVSNVVGATISGGNTLTGTIKDKSTTISSYTQLNKTPAGTFSYRNTAVSPDNCYFVYQAKQDSSTTYEIYTSSFFGSNQLKLSHPYPSGVAALYNYISITPDSKRILYSSEQDAASTWELFSVKPDGTGWTRLNPALPSGSKGIDTSYALTSDGTKVAYRFDEGGGSAFNLYIANVDGTQNRKVNDPISSGGCVQSNPLFSADLSQIGYFGDIATPGTSDLYVTAANGTQSNVKLTSGFPSGASGVSKFKFTPDGQTIVFAADHDTAGVQELYSINVDGSNLTKLNSALATDIIVTDFRISHNSRKVSYITYDHVNMNNYALYVVNIDGTANIALHSPVFNINFGAGSGFTPDDSRIVYTPNDSSIVTSIKPDGTGELAFGSYPGWSNLSAVVSEILTDGRVIYESEQFGGSGGEWAWFIAPAGGGSNPIRLTTTYSMSIPSLYRSPDQTAALYSYSIAGQPCGYINLDGTGNNTSLTTAGVTCSIVGTAWSRRIAVYYGNFAGTGNSYLYAKSF